MLVHVVACVAYPFVLKHFLILYGPLLPFQRVVHQRVLPALSGEFRNPKMIPFILPLILLIADDCTMHEYATLIFPVLIPALQVQDPIQVGPGPNPGRSGTQSRLIWDSIQVDPELNPGPNPGRLLH